MFFFEQTFQTVLNGIDAAGGPMGAITNIANAILLLCVLSARLRTRVSCFVRLR